MVIVRFWWTIPCLAAVLSKPPLKLWINCLTGWKTKESWILVGFLPSDNPIFHRNKLGQCCGKSWARVYASAVKTLTEGTATWGGMNSASHGQDMYGLDLTSSTTTLIFLSWHQLCHPQLQFVSPLSPTFQLVPPCHQSVPFWSTLTVRSFFGQICTLCLTLANFLHKLSKVWNILIIVTQHTPWGALCIPRPIKPLSIYNATRNYC
jgi:hypothetical protein